MSERTRTATPTARPADLLIAASTSWGAPTAMLPLGVRDR